MTTETAIKPTLHHFNLKTTKLQELIDWYAAVVGAEVTFKDATGAWLTNDAANHRIALLAFPGFVDDPDKETRTGMHHSAFEYGSFDELNASYLRLREQGIEPDMCIDHGMTLSYCPRRLHHRPQRLRRASRARRCSPARSRPAAQVPRDRPQLRRPHR
jgi:catechol-2,3-dioxygenase